ncbi:lycopene cyclase family protein [Curtobacterium sp. SL109]|uniref:lycopene cyclase family protein n=1 Tax=Curtobacterium sp. SL109 TaxID=2994662 RepID=UPI002DD427FE|nr:lycopene cyclase family protein [Curtobacterium sp. SL109]
MSSVVAADLTGATTPGAEARIASAPGPIRPALPTAVDIAIIGSGCSGLATAVRLAGQPSQPTVLVLEGRRTPDPRSWCSWDDGSDPLPEARSASWDRWEVRTDHGTSVGSDPDHPYVLVRASNRRAAAERRLHGTSITVIDGTPVRNVTASGDDALIHIPNGTVRAETVLDARGPRCPEHVEPGRVLLHQRFIGQWITTTRPVFDTTTVTLMDFTDQQAGGAVRFIYVLPTSPTVALVESTLFTADGDEPFDHIAHIVNYVQRRWGLSTNEWQVGDEETGCIPMTDAPPAQLTGRTFTQMPSAVIGTTRPSSGYGFARSNRHSIVLAQNLAGGEPIPVFQDRARTRFLDAVFLRFLRDRPEHAAEAFRRLLALHGPLVVRFMTERSTLLDDLRIVLALQKRPFLRALVRTISDTLRRRQHGRVSG